MKVAQWVENCLNSNILSDQINLSLEQRLEITRAIIELIYPLRSSGLTRNRLRRNSRLEDGTVLFYENDPKAGNNKGHN